MAERRAQLLRLLRHRGVGRLNEHRCARVPLLHHANEPESGGRIRLAGPREAGVRDDAQQVLAARAEQRLRLLVGRGQEHLRPGAHAHQLLHAVDALRHERLRLLHDLAVEHRQIRGVEPDRVLDQEDLLDPGDLRVVSGVHQVFRPFDGCQEDPGVTEPHKEPVDGPAFQPLLEEGQLARVVGQEDHRKLRRHLSAPAAELEDVHVADAWHRDDEVRPGVRKLQDGLLGRGHSCDGGGGAQVEFLILGEEHLAQVAVLLEREGVVEAGHQKDAAHAPGHEVGERNALPLDLPRYLFKRAILHGGSRCVMGRTAVTSRRGGPDPP